MRINIVKKRIFDRIENIRKKFSGEVDFDGITYVPTDRPVIGGIAKALETDEFATEGICYKIDDYILNEGSDTSFIADDGEPCGLHDSFSGRYFAYYKPYEKKPSK